MAHDLGIQTDQVLFCAEDDVEGLISCSDQAIDLALNFDFSSLSGHLSATVAFVKTQ